MTAVINKSFQVLLAAALSSAVIAASCTRPAPSATSIPPSPPSPEQLAEEKYAHPEVQRITAEALKQRLDRGENVTIVDTRSAVMFELGHLPGAVDIPIVSEADLTSTTTTEALLSLPRDRLLVLYCD